MEPTKDIEVLLQVGIPIWYKEGIRRIAQEQHRTLKAAVQEAVEKYIEWWSWQKQQQEKKG